MNHAPIRLLHSISCSRGNQPNAGAALVSLSTVIVAINAQLLKTQIRNK